MRKRFFFASFLRTLSYCLMPLLVMSAVYLAITIGAEKRGARELAQQPDADAGKHLSLA